MSLTGASSGETREEIMTRAKEAATKYYGSTCISVTLKNETYNEETIQLGPDLARTTVTCTADWEANTSHNWWEGSSGRIECRHCKKRRTS